MLNRVRIDLRILGFDVAPDEITASLDVFPHRTWIKGDIINTQSSMRHKENGWELSSGLPPDASFNEHLTVLLSVVESNLSKFVEVCSKYYTELSCAIYLYHESEESTPAVHFDKQAIGVLAKLNAEIDMDIYDL